MCSPASTSWFTPVPWLLCRGCCDACDATVPAVVWMHKGAILSRCSQPRAGVFGSRSSKDERLASLLCSRDPYVGGKYLGKDLIGKRLAICDARPYVNAVGNKGKGGGVESISGCVGCGRLQTFGVRMLLTRPLRWWL